MARQKSTGYSSRNTIANDDSGVRLCVTAYVAAMVCRESPKKFRIEYEDIGLKTPDNYLAKEIN